MAVLQNIRVKFGVLISVIIALALLSFIIDPSTLETALNSMSSKYDVGRIAGKSISYTDYLENVEKYTTINQVMTGSSVQSEQAQQQIRDAAWQEAIDKYMFINYAKKAGIMVGEDEMVALTTGDMVSPVIAQNFVDENGQFSPSRLVEFVQGIDSDQSGNMRTFWDYLQNTVYTQQFYQKYGNMYNRSNLLTPLSQKRILAENNTTTDVEYVVERYPISRDTTVKVSSDEIKAYYKAHKEFFKQNASRDIEYVVFEVVPSTEDVAAAGESVDEVYEEFASTTNMKAFLLRNSDRALSSYWYREGELATVSQEIDEFVKGAKVGATSPVYREGNTFRAVRVMAADRLPDNVSVRVIPAADATEITPELLAQLREAQPMNMTQSYLLPGLEGVFSAPLNRPELIKTTQYGVVLAEVVEKSELVDKKQVAILEKTAIASKETFNSFYSQANRFSGIAAGKLEGYRKAVDSLGVYSHSLDRVTEGTSSYGSIDQAREVTRWVFEAKKGQASQILTVNNNYFFVAVLKDIHKEGYAPVAEAANAIHDVIYNEKLREKTLAAVKEKIAGLSDLEQIADRLNTGVDSRTGITFASATGIDPALVGIASVAEIGKVAGPVAGQSGVFIVKPVNRETGSFFTDEDLKNFALQQAQYSSQLVLPAMMVNADVKDNRAKFF